MVFFVCALFLFHPDLKAQVAWNSALLVLAEAEIIMFVFCFLFVLYSVGSFLRSRKKEFGLLLLHGMTVRQMRKMIFMENMLIGAGSIGAGIVAGLLSAKLFLLAGSSLLGIEPLSFHVSLYSLLLTIAAFLLLFVVISLCTTMLLGTTRLIDLFKSDAERNVQPQVSITQAILAAVLLLSAYALAATATASTVKVRMLPATAMTIVGTYLLFTQASVALLNLVKRKHSLYWKRTNLVLVSNLSYRIKDNARMFFLVTIISTVTFCAVGVFASINRLSDKFVLDHPSQIGYVSKAGNRTEEQHLHEIREELKRRNISFRTEEMDLIYAKVASSTLSTVPQEILLISFSDYKRAALAAGTMVNEQAPDSHSALVLLNSQREKLLLQGRTPASYTLQQGIELNEKGITEVVTIPEYLTPELGNDREGTFSGLVVNDEVLEKLDEGVKRDKYTAFYTDSLEQTSGIAAHLTTNGKMTYDRNLPYAMTVSGTLFEVQRTTYGALLFFALLVGTVFFIAAGSFLYFRLYSDLDYDRRQYIALTKLGVTRKEIAKIVTRQLGILFFLPIGVAMLHSMFAFIALQSYLFISIAWESGVILASFCLVQIIYFWFIRSRYLRNLQKATS